MFNTLDYSAVIIVEGKYAEAITGQSIITLHIQGYS